MSEDFDINRALSSIRLTARVDETRRSEPDENEEKRAENAQKVPGHFVQWKDVPEEERPFKSPMQEYVCSQYCFPLDRLRFRWQDTGFDDELNTIEAIPAPERWRERMRSVQILGERMPDVTSVEFQKNMAAADVLQLNSEKQKILWMLDNDVEVDEKSVLDEKTGQLTKQTYSRPMKSRERANNIAALSRINEMIRLAMGQATVIVKDETDRSNQAPTVNFLQIINDPEASRQATLMAKQLTRPKLTPQLPESEPVEAEIVPQGEPVPVESQ